MCPWIKSLLQSERHYKRAIWGLEGPHAFACHSPLVTSDGAEMYAGCPGCIWTIGRLLSLHTLESLLSLFTTQGNILKQRPGVSLPRDFHVQSVLCVMVWGARQRWTTDRGCGCGRSLLNRSLSLSMRLYQVCHSAQIITGREHRAVSKYFLWSCLLYQWVQIQRLYNVNRNLRKDLATQYHSPTSDIHI